MSKVGVVVLIIAAIVFCGLGFVIGQIVQYSGSNIGSDDDPVVTQAYVDKAVGEKVNAMQNEIDQLTAQIEALSKGNSGNQTSGNQTSGNQTSGNQTSGNQTSGNQPSGNSGDTQHVKATADINVRSSASTSGDILATVDSGAVMTYLGSASSSDGTWYNVKLSNGTVGYVASWYCSEIY